MQLMDFLWVVYKKKKVSVVKNSKQSSLLPLQPKALILFMYLLWLIEDYFVPGTFMHSII